MNTITLFIKSNYWHAKFSEQRIIDLFGSDTIMTPYSAAADRKYVIEEITARNPGCEIICNPIGWQTH